MNIVQFYNYIEKKTKEIPLIKSYYTNSVYECWNSDEVRYGSFVIVVKSVTEIQYGTRFNCVLYYGDRLMKGFENRDLIQSDSINVLQSLFEKLRNDDSVGDLSYPIQINLFEQKFTDELAGAYCEITIDIDTNIGCGY